MTMPMGEGAVTAAAPAEAWADEREPAQKPEEPSLSAGEWLSRNLFSSAVNSVLTVVFTLLVLLAVRGLLNFTFSEERTWRAVKTNMRFLFTHAYPQEQYVRIWVCVGAIAVLSGLSIGLLAKTGRGISLKKLSMNLMGSGALIALGILLREPSAVVGDEGAVLHRDAAGAAGDSFVGWLDANALTVLGVLVLANVALAGWFHLQGTYLQGGPGPRVAHGVLVLASIGVLIVEQYAAGEVVREPFSEAMSDRAWWWLAAALLAGAGAAAWFGLGDSRRRNTFVPAMHVFFVVAGMAVLSGWVYPWGHYAFLEGEFISEPGSTVAMTTKLPWTVMWILLVGAYMLGRSLRTARAGPRLRLPLNLLWLLTPFVLYWAVLRDPDLDWDHVLTTDIPMALFFAAFGGLAIWFLAHPRVGEAGRIMAVVLVGVAALNWVAAFFGWYPMLQKARISFLLLAVIALLAHNFAGDRTQRMRLVAAWVALMAVFHWLVTLVNSPSTVKTPTDALVGGFSITLIVSTFTLLLAFPMGVLLALARTSKLPIFRVLSTVYIEVFRGVPLITLLFFFNVIFNLFLPQNMSLVDIAGATVGFALFSAAYLAENIRGGLQAVRRGQYEASDAVGFTTVQRTLFIVLPQALRVSIPPLVGQVIATFKETSLLAVVGIFDFLFIADKVISAQSEFLGVKREGLLFVSFIYWIFAYNMSKHSQRLEKRLGVGER
ncbi:MAG: amino acid ABC transporter permease [Acidimicrobiaceae bacterium]|nr:amino acid ABC transporter permease [Acidimicrobiaceae bacterium]